MIKQLMFLLPTLGMALINGSFADTAVLATQATIV